MPERAWLSSSAWLVAVNPVFMGPDRLLSGKVDRYLLVTKTTSRPNRAISAQRLGGRERCLDVLETSRHVRPTGRDLPDRSLGRGNLCAMAAWPLITGSLFRVPSSP